MKNATLEAVKAGARRVADWFGHASVTENSNWVDDVLARYLSADSRSIVW
ncbi:hypothetical protein VD659_01105 [Herbiconiux sp. 11R-BC]